jgi:hypothetical protein
MIRQATHRAPRNKTQDARKAAILFIGRTEPFPAPRQINPTLSSTTITRNQLA